MSRIMVVEDETHLARGLRFNLEAEGHSVELFGNGEQALQRLVEGGEHVDVVVLDVMLPGIDGFAVVSELRRKENFVPVLMLTALHRPEDVLKGFASGADDYLPKPFDLSILLARINSMLRRRAWHGEERAATTGRNGADESVFEFSGRIVDLGALEVRTASGIFKLTLMEADLLRYLIRNQGKAVSRKQILEDVWGLPEDTDTRAIDNFIVRLRRYIETEAGKPQHLLTVRGVGYKFIADAAT
jgi:DNA-binding response OmpR family regulator